MPKRKPAKPVIFFSLGCLLATVPFLVNDFTPVPALVRRSLLVVAIVAEVIGFRMMMQGKKNGATDYKNN